MRKANEKGITLINLAITIIILIILAAIGIGALGDGGILETSQGAANLNARAEYDETLQLAIVETQIDYLSENKKIDKSYFKQIKGILETKDLYKDSIIKLIKYERNSGVKYENPSDSEVNAIYICTKEGFEFIVDENLVVYDGAGKVYEEIQTGTIILTYSKEMAKEVEVTISKGEELQDSKYILQYKIDNGNWTTYTNKVKVTQNCTIYARIIDKNKRVVAEVQEEITNIDENPPTIENLALEKASDNCLKLTMSVDVQDKETGVEKVVYYYSNNGGSSYNNKAVTVTDNSTEKTTKTQELELAAGTYVIYAEVYDKVGGKSETGKKTITLNHNSVYGGTESVHTKCSICEKILSDTHNYTDTVTSEATCTSNGTKLRTCACGYSKEETITGSHSYGSTSGWAYNSSLTSQKGRSCHAKTQTCSTCGNVKIVDWGYCNSEAYSSTMTGRWFCGCGNATCISSCSWGSEMEYYYRCGICRH